MQQVPSLALSVGWKGVGGTDLNASVVAGGSFCILAVMTELGA